MSQKMWGMKEWLRISVILCTFGFFREMRPSEPFVMEFLSGEWRNITSEQVNREIYPLGTYSYLAQLVVVFLVTDMLRYKPIIVLSAVVGIILWALLLWTSSIAELMLVQLFYGTFMAAEVAYYTYMYAKVDREKYQIVTGHTRSAILAGRFLGGVLAQVLVSYNLMDLRALNFISFGAQIVSLVFALMLPAAEASLYFYAVPSTNSDVAIGLNEDFSIGDTKQNQFTTDNKTEEVTKTLKVQFSWRRAFHLLWRHFIDAYSNSVVIQWSLWWALAMAGYLMIIGYVQILWKEIDANQENFYNGGVEAVLTLLSASGAFLAGFLNSNKYQKWDLWILTICSLIEGLLILVAAFTTSIWVSYVMYVLFGTLYNFMITVASATVAKKLHADSFGLIFGINTIVALIVQTLMTLAIVSDSGFALSPRGQFYTFGGYFVLLSIVYAATGIAFILKPPKELGEES